ncbi:hypothetical protein DFH06DRAFT_1220073 [Mycena polygramma]|nr:hypothetical protein DFH06DRAFT_1220073 [Mycena polygramma]
MLFSGLACFSPSVHASLRSLWVKHGGSLTHSKQDFYQAKVFFCDGPDDPWVKELLSRSLIVRHARWISKSVSEQFAVPVSKYLLDDQFDPTKIAPAGPIPQGTKPTNNLTRKPLTPNRPLAASREESVLPVKYNTLKRALGSENRDESSVELDSRPLKKARIEPTASPQHPVSRTQSPALPAAPIPLFPTRAAHTIYYPSPANSSPPKTPNNSRPRLQADPLRRIDFTVFNPTPALPLLSFARPRPAYRCAANPRPNTNNTNNTQPPRPTIAALLRNPRADACVFAVFEMYRDKVFSAEKKALAEE